MSDDDDNVLTGKRELIFDYVCRFRGRHGHSPALSEIASAVDLSTPTVHYHVEILVEAGLLEKDEGRKRTLRPTQ